jgi:2-polyprenyl-3-methyl-5-hydroxy-6-metoxy-1,4-benzoquinol methylase
LKRLDCYLRDVRIAKARRFVEKGDVVVDVGCLDGAMFERWAGTIEYGYGVDPTLTEKREEPGYVLYPGLFPEALPAEIECDVITMLAVLEHVPRNAQAELAAACERILKPGGRLVITVPSPQVDTILDVLSKLRVIDGMSLEEHYGFEPADTERIFSPPAFRLARKRRFQLGLNNLFVFEKPVAGSA